MSGYNVQRPLFAPAQGKGDDLDLNDLFADYFTNEMDDPLRSFSQTMATSMHPSAASLAQQQLQQQAAAVAGSLPQGQGLPTGRGIKTAFHAGGAAMPTNGAVAYEEPAAKRQRGDDMAASSGISGRLGFSVLGGQLAVPQREEQAAQQQQQQQGGAPVSLPVGVGIRLGGSGGAVAHTPGGGGGSAMTHAQWGASGTGQLTHVQHGQPAAAPGQFQMWGAHGGAGGGGMSEQAVAERRQRNREHAKRSRVRKKFMLESLQQEVSGLQKENELLRMLVQSKIPKHAQDIIDKCCSKNPLFEDEAVSPIHDLGAADAADKEKAKELARTDFSLIESLTSGQQNFVLSDPRLPDNPIVYASEGFYELTGYTRDQVLGRNCRFLQGPGTDPKAVDVIRTAVANGSDATTCILNYKADGTPFWNQFFVAALRDQDNCIVNYVGVQCAIEPEAGVNALEDKVNAVMPLMEKEGSDDGEK